jgi:hypothetical protein
MVCWIASVTYKDIQSGMHLIWLDVECATPV